MSTTEPIKNKKDLIKFKEYYEKIQPDSRNALLMTMGLNTALRIGDILELRWKDVYSFEKKRMREHIRVCEQKTGKQNMIAMNGAIVKELKSYHRENGDIQPDDYLFQSKKMKGMGLSRFQAFRIVQEAANYAKIDAHISCHSLRKTFGYHAWKQGVPPALLMKIFNHSSYQITMRYLCIEQEDKDEVFRNIVL